MIQRETIVLKGRNDKFLRKRESIKIIAQILEVATNPVTITSLVYKVQLHYSILTKYLIELTSAKLIESISGENMKTRYRTTKKGEKYLLVMRELEEMISSTAKGKRKH